MNRRDDGGHVHRARSGFSSDTVIFCALSSVVEHYLHTVGVAGSKPAARTILIYQ
jgi:hypothetical protein